MRRLVVVGAVALSGLLLVAAVAAAFLVHADLAPHAARLIRAEIERDVSLDSLELGWRDGVTVELRGLRIANAPWGEAPHMATLDAASARLDLGALIGGRMRYDHLRLSGLRVALERGPDGAGNWEFAGASAPPRSGEVVPTGRAQFPTLLDAELDDALITYRTSGATRLAIELETARIGAADDDEPAAIMAAGAYNGVPARIDGTGESFDVMRDADRPYGVGFTIETQSTTARFDGTLMRPLDFDGADGRLVIDAADTGDLNRMFRSGIDTSFPLAIAGHMIRDGDDWRLEGAEGALADNAFSGDLRLAEAPRGGPDEVIADLDFATLDMASLLGQDAGGAGGYMSMPLAPPEPVGINIDAALTAGTLVLGGARLADAALEARVGGRNVAVDSAAFALADGRVTLSGSSTTDEDRVQVKIDARLDTVSGGALAESLGAAPGDLAGAVSGRAILDMTGRTLGDALPNSRGHAVVTMEGGAIARDLLEKASTDLRSLFRDQEGNAGIHCLLGIVDLQDGVGRVPVIRLRTAEATLNGTGSLDLMSRRVDLTFMTAPDSTGFFALDMPFRVHGRLDGPTVEPRLGGGPRPGEFATAAARGDTLPAELKQLAQGNACRA